MYCDVWCCSNSIQVQLVPHKTDTLTLRHPRSLQGFYSVHGDAALFIARDFYRTLVVVKYLGGPPPSGTPGATPKPGSNSSTKPSTPAGSSKGGLASVTMNRSLFEGVLRSLLLEGGQHSVELWEGAGANWSLSK